MAVDLIGGGASSAQQALDLQQSSLGQQQFLQILLTQLKYQDPMKPLDNQQFLAQMAQFSSLSQAAQTNSKIDTLLTIQSATQSIGLIGKSVQVETTAGQQTGSVSAISFSSGQPSLSVTTTSGQVLTEINLSQVSLVQ